MLLHATLPQVHFSLFLAEPFVTRQAGAKQVLVEDVQIRPVDSSLHIEVPQAHELIPMFTAEPSVVTQAAGILVSEQMLVEAEDEQYRPDVSVHATVPHKHVASLEVVPSVSVQGSAVMQRQRSEEEQDVVEVDNVL